MRRIAPALAILVLAPVALAQTDDAGEERPDETRTLEFSLQTGYVHQFEADFDDDGGELDVQRAGLRFGVRAPLNKKLTLGVTATAAAWQYDFDGTAGFAALDPWDDVQRFSIGARLEYQLDKQWAVFGGGRAAWSYESGASASDGFTGAGFIGASWARDQNLILGLGIGVRSVIKDDPRLFPLVFVNWTINSQLRLQSARVGSVGAAGGGVGGLELAWTPPSLDKLTVGVGAEWLSLRFRLDDDGVAPEGAGEEEGVAIRARATWSFSDNARISLIGGVLAAGELTLDDRDENRIAQEDYDPAAFVGVSFSADF